MSRALTTHDSQGGAEHRHVAKVEGGLEQPVHSETAKTNRRLGRLE